MDDVTYVEIEYTSKAGLDPTRKRATVTVVGDCNDLAIYRAIQGRPDINCATYRVISKSRNPFVAPTTGRKLCLSG